jgi:phosphatidylglycerol:prolipoprotein diacylglycerol transferase
MLTFAVLTFPNIDPVLFSIGPFAVRWYALAYIVGIIFGIWYMKRLVSNPKLWAGTTPSATPKQIDDFFLLAMLGVVLGGRIGYLMFYGWTQIAADPLYIFRVWEGGMSFHGGFFGVILVSYIYARRNGIGLDRLLDLGAAATPVGLGLGRLANFINGELYGRETICHGPLCFRMTSQACRAIPASFMNSSSKGCCCSRSSTTPFTATRF